jgi:alpha-galactosidase
LHGELLPERPDLLYPLATARDADTGRHFVCRHAPHPVRLPAAWSEPRIANTDDGTPIVLNDGPPVAVHVEIQDARNLVTHQADTELGTGASILPVPSGGPARITPADPAA